MGSATRKIIRSWWHNLDALCPALSQPPKYQYQGELAASENIDTRRDILAASTLI
jgi:hypothetical protein